jgi:ABC-2 type transport system permease protein
MKLIRDTWLIFERSMYLTLHNPVWVVFGLIQPLLFLLLFGPILNSIAVSAAGFPPGGAFNVFVPGLLIQISLFGAAFVGFGLIAELRAGVLERMRVTPLSRASMLLGRALRDVVVLVVQGILLVLVALPFGLTIDPIGFLVSLGLLALVGLVMAPLSYTFALMLKSEDALAPLLNGIALPLLLLSGILLPLTLAPDWLQALARLDPLSYAVTAIRALFNGKYADPAVATGVGLMAVLAIGAVLVGRRAFARVAA